MPDKPDPKKKVPFPIDDGPLMEGLDFYVEENGLMVFTAHYLKRRGYCCCSGCRHCPYGFEK